MRGLLQHWTESSIIPTSKGSVWRNKKPKRRTVSFVEDRSLTQSTSTSGSLEPTILSRIMPTYLLLFFEMTIFRNLIRSGAEFCCLSRKSHLMTSWKVCTNTEYESLRNSRPYWNCTKGVSSEEWWTWLSQIENNGKKKYRERFTKQELWSQKWKLWKKRRGQESGDKTAWTKNYWRLLAVGKSMGSALKETIAVSSRC